MAFLDNSGDIILDAVLTDTGRMRLAKGDGTFKIVKFSLADDEIDYSLYQNANHASGAHASGSAYYDLNILMTPVIEAFTNNESGMKSKLISIPRNNLLYLPTLKLNALYGTTNPNQDVTLGNGTHVVAVDEATEAAFSNLGGVLSGFTTENISGNDWDNYIRIEQGLDTTEISQSEILDNDLRETQYIVEMDNRLGVYARTGAAGKLVDVSYIDDDNIASYYISKGAEKWGTVREIPLYEDNKTYKCSLAGPRGTVVLINIKASLELSTSTHMFTKFGGTGSLTVDGTAYTYKYIDTIIRVTGATTGASIDIPVRYVKND